MTAPFFPRVSGEIALAVADHLWQSTVVALIVALLALALKKNYARIRYWLWFAASLKFFIPFSLLVILGSHLTWLHHASPRQTMDASPGTYLMMEEVSQPFTLVSVPSTPTAPVPKAVSATERVAGFHGGSLFPTILTAVWLLGVLIVSTRWIRRWRRIWAIARTTPTLCEGREVDALRRMQHPGRFRRTVDLKMLPIPVEPGIFGLFRPVLLWPQEISQRLNDAQLEAVIAHEVCHVRRGDNITAAMHMAVEAIFWFHPLVWWLETRLLKERESACDEEVLQMCGQARAYAESILKVCEFCVESPLACVSGIAGADLRRRVADIVMGRTLLRMTWPKKLLLIATAVSVVAAPVVLGQAQRLMVEVAKIAPKPVKATAYAMLPVDQAATDATDSALAALDSPQAAVPQPALQQRTANTPAQNPAVPQDKLVGNWQGTLQLDHGNGLRTVVKITEDDGKYRGQFYSIDQGPGSMALSSVSLAGASVMFTIQAIDLTYNGTLNPDGNTISGSSTQHGQAHVLNLDHVSAENVWAIPEPPKAMPADAKPKFDVLTVKPSDPNRPGKLFTVQGRDVKTINTSVSDLITFAYGLHPKQLVDGPDWLDQKYDLDGVPDVDGRPSLQQMRILLQDALATRFGLKFHHDRRELAVYALTVAKGGPRMTVTADSPSAPRNFLFGGLGQLHVTNSTMKDLCDGMQGAVMDKPVVDQTGLTDRYDFNLNWTPDEGQFAALGGYTPRAQEDPNAQPSLYTALQEQLGLKLESTRAMVDTFVIDQIEKPGAN